MIRDVVSFVALPEVPRFCRDSGGSPETTLELSAIGKSSGTDDWGLAAPRFRPL